jgi:hypothetical protein
MPVSSLPFPLLSFFPSRPNAALRVPIKWEVFERVGDITQNFDLLASLARNQICLKGMYYYLSSPIPRPSLSRMPRVPNPAIPRILACVQVS